MRNVMEAVRLSNDDSQVEIVNYANEIGQIEHADLQWSSDVNLLYIK